MKTKELIRQLQNADPSGEAEVCVGNVDIHFVETQPAYYDGTLQVLIRDETIRGYNIVGGKYKRTGNKVNLQTLSISDVVAEDAEAVIDYSELSEESAERTKKAHDSLREYVKNIENEMELENFTKWVKLHAEKLTVDLEDVDDVANRFFHKNITRNDPLPEGGVPLGHSYVSTRAMQWDQKYKVVIENGFLKVLPN